MKIQFDKAKLKAVILYACTKCGDGELGAVKMHKVLYFLDMLHYADVGAPVTGSTYRKRALGPTNDQLLAILREMKLSGDIDVREADYFGYRKIEYVALVQPKIELLSKRELALLDEIIDFVCAQNTAKTISEFSHSRAWEMVDFGDEIPYNSVFMILPTQVSPESMEWGASQAGSIEAERSKGNPMGGTDFGAIRRRVLERHGKLGQFQHQAQREPVEITRHGRREFVLMSAEHYDWLRAAAQRTHRTDTATEVVIAAVENAEMDPEHSALDDLLK